jgi:hypothetical protein
MTDRPILMSAPMVRAILAGTKTQTRRIAKPRRSIEPMTDECPYGQPGDRLRVKESAWMWCERRPNGKTKTGRDKWLYVPMREAPIHYAADHPRRPTIDVVSPDTGNVWGWRLKIGRFLPAWASRITLEITAVRVQRLQDISEADALSEGIVPTHDGYGLPDGRHFHAADPRISYWSLWDSINGQGSTESNPWVWAVSFRSAP